MATEAKISLVAEDRVSQVVRQVQGSLGQLTSTIGNLGAGLGLTALVGGLRSIIGALDDLSEAAQGIGVTAKQLAELRLAASESGVSAEKLDTALGNLNNKIADAAAGNRDAVRLFSDLGVAFKDSSGNARATIDVLRDIARVFQGSADGAGKTALAMEALGKAGRLMVPYLNQGADALEKFAGVTDASVAEAAKLQGEIDKLTASFKALLAEIGGKFAGGVNKLFDKGAVEDQIRELQTIISSMEQSQVGDPKNLERYRAQLAKLRAEAEASARFAATDNPAGRDLVKTDQAAADRLRKAREDSAKLSADARREFQQAGLKAVLDEETAAARRAAGVVAEYNRVLEESVRIREEDRQVGLETNRRREEADAARARAQLEQFNRELEDSKKLGEDLGLVFESAVSKLFTAGEGLTAGNFFKSLATDIAQVITKILIMEPLMKKLRESLQGIGGGSTGGQGLLASFLASLFGTAGARAMGGPVSAGMPYLVGERGPEFFVPAVSGTVVPNDGISGATVNQYINVDSRSDRTTILQAMAMARNEAVRAVGEQLARRGPLSRI